MLFVCNGDMMRIMKKRIFYIFEASLDISCCAHPQGRKSVFLTGVTWVEYFTNIYRYAQLIENFHCFIKLTV